MLAEFDPGVTVPGFVTIFRNSSAEDEDVTKSPKEAAAAAVHQKSPITNQLAREEFAHKESKRKRKKDADPNDKVDETPSKRIKLEKTDDNEGNSDGDLDSSTDIQISSGAEA